MRAVGWQLAVRTRLPALTRARIGFTRPAERIATQAGLLELEVIAVPSVPDPSYQGRCGGSPRGGVLAMPSGPGLEVLDMPVPSGQFIGHGGLLVRVGGIKQEPDCLMGGSGSFLTCAFGAPVQLRNPLLELVQVAPGEQGVSAGLHDPCMPVDGRPG